MLDGRCDLLSEIVELESETNVKAGKILRADLVVGNGSFVAVGNPSLVRDDEAVA